MFVGMGISGGEERAHNGPSLMPGGPKEAYDDAVLLRSVMEHVQIMLVPLEVVPM